MGNPIPPHTPLVLPNGEGNPPLILNAEQSAAQGGSGLYLAKGPVGDRSRWPWLGRSVCRFGPNRLH